MIKHIIIFLTAFSFFTTNIFSNHNLHDENLKNNQFNEKFYEYLINSIENTEELLSGFSQDFDVIDLYTYEIIIGLKTRIRTLKEVLESYVVIYHQFN